MSFDMMLFKVLKQTAERRGITITHLIHNILVGWYRTRNGNQPLRTDVEEITVEELLNEE